MRRRAFVQGATAGLLAVFGRIARRCSGQSQDTVAPCGELAEEP